jgi:hypothetical protein
MRMALLNNKVQRKAAGGVAKLAKSLIAKGAKAADVAGELAAAKQAPEIGQGLLDVERKPKGTVPAVFERVPPKTKEEIRAIAERMAPQALGQFAPAKPRGTISVAGKSKKVFDREQNLPVDIRDTKILPPSQDVDMQSLRNNVMVGIPGDPSEANKALYGVGSTKLAEGVPLFGGPRYGQGNSKIWASEFPAASGLQNLASRASEAYGVPAVGNYLRMPEGMHYALHNLDALLAIQQPENLSAKSLAQLNNLIRKGSPKYGKFADFAGFEDPDLVLLQSQLNPKLRKHISETLTKPTYTDKFGLTSGQDVQTAITIPELRNVEPGTSGYTIGRLKPNEALTDSSHPTYGKDIPGDFIGNMKYPTPYELSFPDTNKFAIEEAAKTPGVQPFNMFKMSGPRQIIDNQLIDEIKQYEEMMKSLTGKKKGGVIKAAQGGEITSDDLIVDERPL